MQNLRWLLLILLIASLAIACQGEDPQLRLQELEARFEALTDRSSGKGANPESIRTAMVELAEGYLAFVAARPDDPQAPAYLYKAAELYETNMLDLNRSLAIYDQLLEAYPNHPRAADGLFKQGFVYHNTLNELEKARRAYSLFLEKYPDHEMAASARFEIENLGVSTQEIFERIQQKQQSMNADSL
jgi:tetratricopeptide (TPR) repeat protein